MEAERIIGIDFGTSTSVIRVKRYENGIPLGEKLDTKGVVFGNGMGEIVPTLIQKKDNDESITYYGYQARKKRQMHTTYHSFKVDLESIDPEKCALARKLTEEFFCYLVKTYKAQSEGGHLGDPGDNERTIVSYPVKWSEETRSFMIDAAKRAGFPNVSGMDEAQAAIHAVTVMSEDHLRKNNLLANGKSTNILLIDMGAGTTDLVLCCHTPGKTPKTEILTTWPKNSEILFGGREVDHLLQGFFRDYMKPEDLERALKSVGVDQFKSWKEEFVSPALAKSDAVMDFYALDNYAENVGIKMDEYTLNRAGFEKCMGGYLKQLPELINGCLNSAGMNGSDVDLVIVTGGHSQWYFVKEMIAGKMPKFGNLELVKLKADPSRIIQITRPQETVALGLVYGQLTQNQDNADILYQQGIKIGEKDPQKANELYLRAAALGNTEAMNRLGYCYDYGIGVPESPGMAAVWYRKAADLGNSKAAYNLGVCYYHGSGVSRSLENAIELYKKAADLGFSKAIHSLGLFYLNGEGVPKDTIKAAELFQKAADLGIVQAMNQLAICYKYGWGVEKNLSKALDLFHKAADQGDIMAMYNLGINYWSSNKNEAFQWLHKAADQGHVLAQRKVGFYYYSGIGTKENITLAHTYSLRAAEQGDVVAQWNMSCLLYSKSPSDAAFWCRKAADNGYHKARKAIERYDRIGKWPFFMLPDCNSAD